MPSLSQLVSFFLRKSPKSKPKAGKQEIEVVKAHVSTFAPIGKGPPLGLTFCSTNSSSWPYTAASIFDASTAPLCRSYVPLNISSMSTKSADSSRSTPVKHTIKYMTPTNHTMTSQQVNEVIATLSASFGHIPYVIGGSAALVCHGNTIQQPNHVEMLCPQDSVDKIRCWAVKQGVPLSPYHDCDIGIRTSDGILRRVRVTGSSGFGNLDLRKLSSAQRVLRLPYMADRLAEDYMNHVDRGSRYHRSICIRDIIWILGHMSAKRSKLGKKRLEGNTDKLVYLSNLQFVERFLEDVPLGLGLLARAGLFDIKLGVCPTWK